jgi:gamma-glutamyltranspeptidase
VVAGNTGVVLQNRGAYFSLDPAHPNRLEPGKIPLHTLIASMAKRDGKLWSVVGCMGADGQPQIQLQLYSAMIDHGLDIQQAIEMPRFLSGRFALGEARDTLHLEGRIPPETIAALEQHFPEVSDKATTFPPPACKRRGNGARKPAGCPDLTVLRRPRKIGA